MCVFLWWKRFLKRRIYFFKRRIYKEDVKAITLWLLYLEKKENMKSIPFKGFPSSSVHCNSKPTGKRVQICTYFIKEANQKRKKLERDFFHFVLHLLLLCTLLVLYYFFPSKHLLVLNTSSTRLEHVLNTSSTRLQRKNFTSSKTSWRHLARSLGRRKIITLKTSWRRLEDMSWRRLEDIMATSKILTGDICI